MTKIDVDTFAQRSVLFEQSIDQNFRKENGIYYTDITLANLILEYLNPRPGSTLLDPCCGTGSFLLAGKYNGFLDKNIYGADFDQETVKMCKMFTGLENIKVLNTLDTPGKKQLSLFAVRDAFDYVVGNPPYAPLSKEFRIDTSDYLFQRITRESGSNMFVAAMYRSFELVKPNGIVSYIIPKNFLHVSSYGILRKKILKEMKIISIIDLGSYFKGVRGEQVIFTFEKANPAGNLISIGRYTGKAFDFPLEIEQDFFKDEIFLFENLYDFDLFRKLESSYQKFDDILTGYIGRGRASKIGAVTGKDIRKFGLRNKDTPKSGNKLFIQNIYSAEAGIIACFGGDLEATETVTVLTDGDIKMCKYILGILHSRLCNYYLLKFCFNNSKLTMHTDGKYLRKIPLVISSQLFDQIVNAVFLAERVKYLSEEWFQVLEALNSLVYKAYDLDNEQIRYIDQTMKTVQSKRWFYGS